MKRTETKKVGIVTGLNKIISILALFIFSDVVLNSCKKEPSEKKEKPFEIAAGGGSFKVVLDLTSDLVWEIVEKPNWLQPSISNNSSGETILTVDVSINLSLEERSSSIVVTGNGVRSVSKTVEVVQAAPELQTIKMNSTAAEVMFDVTSPAIQIDWGDKNKEMMTENFNKSCVHTYTDGLAQHSITVTGIFITYFIGDSIGLTSLDISNCPDLLYVECHNNALKTLDAANCPDLKGFYCGNNQLTEVDVCKNKKLVYLDIQGNQIADLQVNENTTLTNIECSHNLLSDKALNTLFHSLTAVNDDEREVRIKGNPGTPTCDHTIAQKKGWIVKTIYDDLLN